MKLLRNSQHGQAMIEYLLIFVFMLLILSNFTKGINKIFGEAIGSLRVILTNELTVGMCENDDKCLYKDSYKN